MTRSSVAVAPVFAAGPDRGKRSGIVDIHAVSKTGK
jgi:hypothetical protein